MEKQKIQRNNINVILASASPRRQDLLQLIFDDFYISPADVDENIEAPENVEKFSEQLACLKARAVEEKNFGCFVIGCDTSVIVEDIILGKPKDKEECRKMIKLLSGRKHKVVTGCCLRLNGRECSFSDTTIVEFYPVTDEEIENYLSVKEERSSVKYQWQDKAGGYGIQGAAGLFVKGIEGDYNNVVGMPVALLNREIKKFLKD